MSDYWGGVNDFKDLSEYIDINGSTIPYLQMFREFPDPGIIVHLPDPDDIGTMILVKYNNAAYEYYIKYNFTLQFGDRIQDHNRKPIGELKTFQTVYASLLSGEPRSCDNHFSEHSGNFISLQSYPINSNTAIAFFNDITNKELTKRKLEDTTKKLETIFEHSPLGIIGEQKGMIKLVNPKVQTLLGFSEFELLGESVFDLFIPEERQKIRERTQRRIAGIAEPKQYRSRFVKKDGTTFPVQIFASSVVIDGVPLTFAFIHDLSREAELQDLLMYRQRLDALNILASGIAHDFNNLLTIIIGQLDIISLKGNSKQFRENLSIAKTAAGKAGEIINKIRYLAEEPGNQMETFDFYDVINEVFGLIRAPSKMNLTKEIAFEPGIFTYYGDPTDFHQIFMNLSLNSLQAFENYSGDHKIRINIEMIDGGSHYLITHQDSGPGISEELRSSIFQPFYTTKAENVNNTGLGLTMVHRLITERYRGNICLDQKIREGTIFEIRLPIS